MTQTTSELEPRVYTLRPGEWEATQHRIAKINARAVKRGFTGRIDLTGEPFQVEETNELGLTVTRLMYKVTLGGEPPRYGGWTFLAELDWDQHAGLITRCAPGVEHIDRSKLREGACDHCNADRLRRNIYLLGHDDGRQLQVGSTCIKDFLGWAGRPVFYSESDIAEGIDEFLGTYGGSAADDSYTVETVLAAAWASCQRFGYRRAADDSPTKGHVQYMLDPPREWRAREQWRNDMAEMQPYIDGSAAQARIVREWVVTELTGNSEYVTNLKAIAAADYCTWTNLGMLVSAPQTWARAQERDLTRKAQEANEPEVCNEWVGAVKQRLEFEATVKVIRWIDSTDHFGRYISKAKYTLLDETGHVLVWWTTTAGLGETAGARFRIRGTVKKHGEWKGTKETELTRCTVLAELPADGQPADVPQPLAA